MLAIRGTEGLIDALEDVNRIGLQGYAGDQAVSLYRYYKKLITPAGQPVQYSNDEVGLLASMRLKLPVRLSLFTAAFPLLRAELSRDQGLAPLTGGGASVIPQGAPLIVTGHSLGGHLAVLFARLFPGAAEHVYTYNAPGIGPQGELALWSLGVSRVPEDLVTNVASAQGEELISRIWSKPGETVGIATEPGTILYTHSIVPLTDALAIYDALDTLSPGLDARSVGEMIAAASPFPEDSLEVMADHLGTLLEAANPPTGIAIVIADLAQRDSYYANLHAALDSREPGLDYEIESLAGMSAREIAELARDDAAVRFALRERMPFAAHGAEPAESGDELSGPWIASRAEWLEASLEGNSAERAFGYSGGPDNLLFVDIESGASYSMLDDVQAGLAPQTGGRADQGRLQAFLGQVPYSGRIVFGAGSSDDLAGLAGADRLFGGAGADRLDGAAGDDYLEGGSGSDILLGGDGDDTLAGGPGQDRLEGGAGIDTYVFAEVLDADTIVDRGGFVFAGGIRLTGGTGTAGEGYESSDGRFRYRFDAGALVVNGSLRIDGFLNGDLGIRLREDREPDDALPPGAAGGTLLLGDYDYDSYWDEATHRYYGFDEYGNPSSDAIATFVADRVDTNEDFQGTPESTHFITGGGNDVMQDLLGGDDWLELGTGDDAGWGGTGDDTVEGGPGRDRVAGGRGNDVLYAGSAASVAADLDDGGLPALPYAGDLLSGGDGDDYLFGDAEANLIEAGPGDDHVYAGAGDDWIGADVAVLAAAERYRVHPPNNDWINREVDFLWHPFQDLPAFALGPPAPFGTPRQATINGKEASVVVSAADGDDYIDAGAGNDTIFAGDGDDVIYAGSGDDYVDPGHGAETILGEAGRDYIVQWFGDPIGDDIDGGDGDDFIVDIAGEGNRIDGGAGNDYLQSGAGADVLLGGEGNDQIFSSGGDDVILGGDGNDQVRWAASGYGLLAGGAGDDRLVAVLQHRSGAATFAWGPGDGNDMGLALGGRAALQLVALEPGAVSVRYVTGVPTGELVVEGQPEALGSGFRFELEGGAGSFVLLEIPEHFGQSDVSVRFADGTTWDDAILRSLAAAADAPAAPGLRAGTAADDVVYGSAGADRFASSAGDDWLIGGAGEDLYEYAFGHGFDRIEDEAGADALRLTGVDAGGVAVFASGTDYILAVGEGGVRIHGGRTPERSIEDIGFADGSHWSAADLENRAVVLPDNRAPTMPASIGSVSVEPGGHAELAVPREAVTDPDRFDSVSYYAITAQGEALPDWMSFDPVSLKFAATPGAGDAGRHDLLLIAVDATGAASAGTVTIDVGVENAPPPPEAPPAAATAATDGNAADAFAFASELPAVVGRRDHLLPIGTPADAVVEVPRVEADAPDPVYRGMLRSLDMLLQTGHASLGEEYSEAIREFEERRLEREAQELPPPTDEEVEAWNSAMHDWHHRHPGYSEADIGGGGGTWSAGWGLPASGNQAPGGSMSLDTLLGVANPAALPGLKGVALQPSLAEGLTVLR